MGLNPGDIQFLRPLWLAAWPLLLLLLWGWRRRRGEAGAWQRSVDPHLLPHLLQQVEVRGGRAPMLLALLGGTLAVLALAGPSWREQAQPMWQREAPLVIALDLSAAARATDLKPSRLAQAQAKIERLLAARTSGQVGLLAYAGHAFTVAPITRDGRTVQALLTSLSPDVMPVEGQRVDRAIRHAMKMLRAADATRGDILLLSDRSDAAGAQAAAQARAAGFRVSAIGVGTLAGAPLSGREGFIIGADGQPQLARLDPASLQALAAAGGGGYAALSPDDQDLAALGVLHNAGGAQSAGLDEARSGEGGQAGATPSDDGYWLLLGLLPLVLVGFRRGWLALLPLTLALALTATPPEAYAEADTNTNTNASSFWDSLWRRADQRAHDALQAGDAASARALAPGADLRAAAAFREKDYAAAADSWAAIDNADAHYNRGNALAQAGKLKEALDAYDAALARSPGMEDAIANRKAVEEVLKQQQSQQQKSDQKQDGQKQDGQKQDGQQQQGEQQQGEQQQGEQKQGEQQQGEQQQGEQQQGEKPQGEQQQSEQQQSEKQQGEQQKGEKQQPGGEPQGEADEATRQAAEEAARREMQQALDARDGKEPEGEPAPAVELTPEQRARMEQRQANEQLLRRVPDDPGALLRRKFELEYQRRLREGEDR